MQKLSMQRWVSSVRLVQQRLRQGERFVDRFGLQNFKWIMLKDGPNQDNFCKTAAMSLGPQGQRRAVISVWRNVVRQVQYQRRRGRSAWPKTVLFNMETQAIPRKKCQIGEDLGEIGGSPRNVAEKNGEAEHFFYWAPSGFSTEDYWGNVGNVGKHTGGIFYLGDEDKCSQASTTKFTNAEYNRIKKIGKKWRECAQHQRVRSRIRHWQTVTRHQRLCIHLVNIREKSFQPQLMQLGSDDVTDPGLDVISKRSRSRWSRRHQASAAPTWRETAAAMRMAGRRQQQRRRQRGRQMHRSRPTKGADGGKGGRAEVISPAWTARRRPRAREKNDMGRRVPWPTLPTSTSTM